VQEEVWGVVGPQQQEAMPESVGIPPSAHYSLASAVVLVKAAKKPSMVGVEEAAARLASVLPVPLVVLAQVVPQTIPS
jgi:hypothetical protein